MASITTRNDRFCVIYPYVDDKGNRRQKWETFQTLQEAKARKAEIEYSQQLGTFTIPNCTTVSELLSEYVSLYGKTKWSISAYTANTALIAHYIEPHLGNMKLREITARSLEKYYQTLLKTPAVHKMTDRKSKKTNLYDRMKITLDLLDELNDEYGGEQRIAAFSFPMRYIPLSAHERGYVGSQWNAKYLRAVQRMLVPTQGKGVCSRSFFEADFGLNADDFVRYLSMPERLIAARGKISTTSRGKTAETAEQYAIRRAGWERDQKKIDVWNKLYAQLGKEHDDFVNLIGDNEYLPEKVLSISSVLQKKMYLLYLTTPRLVSLLGMLDKSSPTCTVVKEFVEEECHELYLDILDLVSESEVQQNYVFRNYVDFFGRRGIVDLLTRLNMIDYAADKQLTKWDTIAKKEGIGYIDFELIRVYRRFVDLDVLPDDDHEAAKKYIMTMKMAELASILHAHIKEFESSLLAAIDDEKGQALLRKVSKTITNNIQLKLENFLGES